MLYSKDILIANSMSFIANYFLYIYGEVRPEIILNKCKNKLGKRYRHLTS